MREEATKHVSYADLILTLNDREESCVSRVVPPKK